MAGPVYRLFMARRTEAGYQLSEEEQSSHEAKVMESLERVGARFVVSCRSRWSSEQWSGFGVIEFPDIEAVQKHSEDLRALNHHRYVEAISILGTKA